MRPARRVRGVLALALVLAFLGPGGTPVAQAVPLSTYSPAPPYLSGLGTTFWASSNKAWTKAIELSADQSNNPLGKEPGKGDPFTDVWARSCGAGGQKVTFRRTLDLPGRAVATTVVFQPVFAVSPSPFKTYAVTVNGEKVAGGKVTPTSYSSHETKLSAAKLKAFEDGDNEVVVTVTRGALPGGLKKCNTADAATKLAVRWWMYGDYVADLALVDQIPAKQYRLAAATNTQIVNISLRNLGPSTAVKGGQFDLTVFGVSDVLMLGDLTTPLPGTYPTGPPFDQCSPTVATPAPNLKVVIHCDLSAMTSGDRGYLSIGFTRDAPSTPFTSMSSFLTWTVGHPADADSTSNTRSVEFVWCGGLSTDPGCVAVQPAP